MSTKTRYKLRLAFLFGWLVLALVAVMPVLAQGDETSSSTTLDTQDAAPQDLDDIAVRLTPLLVGAALIERTLEFVFNWVERVILDTTHRLHDWATRLTGLVQIDLRQAWGDLEELTNVLLKRKTDQAMSGRGGEEEGDPDSNNPQEWPLAMLEAKVFQANETLATAESVLERSMKSSDYVARKKMVASWISIMAGIALAFSADLRLFQPLGVDVANWFNGAFDVVDTVLAGILMGLGTEWVHQVIGLLIQGKGLLGRAGGGGAQLDPAYINQLVDQSINQRFEERLNEVLQTLEGKLGQIDELGIDLDIKPPT